MNRLLIIIAACLLLFPAINFGQTRTRRTSTPRKAQSASSAQAEIRLAGATKVANQIKNLTAFLYLLGGIATRIEEIDQTARSSGGSTTTSQQNEQNKARLRQSFEDFRVGLDALEVHFRSTPGLQSYYLRLAGSAAAAATAENQAAAGQFNRAGRTLIDVVSRLTDVLVIMR